MQHMEDKRLRKFPVVYVLNQFFSINIVFTLLMGIFCFLFVWFFPGCGFSESPQVFVYGEGSSWLFSCRMTSN